MYNGELKLETQIQMFDQFWLHKRSEKEESNVKATEDIYFSLYMHSLAKSMSVHDVSSVGHILSIRDMFFDHAFLKLLW